MKRLLLLFILFANLGFTQSKTTPPKLKEILSVMSQGKNEGVYDFMHHFSSNELGEIKNLVNNFRKEKINFWIVTVGDRTPLKKFAGLVYKNLSLDKSDVLIVISKRGMVSKSSIFNGKETILDNLLRESLKDYHRSMAFGIKKFSNSIFNEIKNMQSAKVMAVELVIFIVLGVILAGGIFYYINKKRLEGTFKKEFNQVSVLFFSVGQKLDFYPEYRDRYLYIHEKLDEIQFETPKVGLSRLASIKENLKHLVLDLEAKEKL
ncbi:MAG: hypothetical protein OEV44_02135 [Spirochaetota bacterium]|nr:hypothetical protein [Spirochaetota bacterium]